MDLINKKLMDYQVENYPKKLNETIEKLDNIIFGPEFKNQMSRFLQEDIQKKTLLSEKFLHVLLRETKVTFNECGSKLWID